MTDMTPVSPETMARELLACPFCGNDRPKIRSNGIGDYYVVCDGDEDAVHCEASTSDRRCETVEGAVRRWNRRAGYSAALAAPLTVTDEMVERFCESYYRGFWERDATEDHKALSRSQVRKAMERALHA
jgi:hypothetical protein